MNIIFNQIYPVYCFSILNKKTLFDGWQTNFFEERSFEHNFVLLRIIESLSAQPYHDFQRTMYIIYFICFITHVYIFRGNSSALTFE